MNVCGIAEKERATHAKLCGDAVVHVISRKPVHAIDRQLHVLDDSLTDIRKPEFFSAIRRIFTNAANQSNMPVSFEWKEREKIRVIELEIDLAVYRRSMGFDVGDIEQLGVSPAGESNIQRFTNRRMRTVAACDVNGLTDFLGAVRFF